MHNETEFFLTNQQSGLTAQDVPKVFRLRQHFERPIQQDVAATVLAELAPTLANLTAGQHIAITGSSRGISNFATVVKTTVKAVKAAGAHPFVVPGMGSHGGATVAGQVQVLADTHGLTEDTLGCPIRATMDTVQVGVTASGFAVHQDKNCHEADGVIVINRVKPHTSFTEVVESGLCKMLVIGLGKQVGASAIHQQSLRVPMGEMVLDASRIIIEADKPKIIGAIALVENPFKETALIKACRVDTHENLVADESALLRRAYELFPRIPFAHLDALIIDEMGKNISGSGMDTNVIGKKQGLTTPQISAIYVRGLTLETHGNATGIGLADLMLRDTLPELDLNSTYMNAFTAKRLFIAKIPMLVANEMQAMHVLGNFRQQTSIDSLRMAWIRNTSKLDELWASSALLDEAKENDRLEVLSDPQPLTYDAQSRLVLPVTA